MEFYTEVITVPLPYYIRKIVSLDEIAAIWSIYFRYDMLYYEFFSTNRKEIYSMIFYGVEISVLDIDSVDINPYSFVSKLYLALSETYQIRANPQIRNIH